MTSSPSTPPHSSKPLFEVSTVDARSTPRRGHEENWKFETHSHRRSTRTPTWSGGSASADFAASTTERPHEGAADYLHLTG